MNDASAPTVTGATSIDGRMPSFGAAFRVWLRIGFLSFGGPAGQIALLHREVVDNRHWIGERRFLHALSFCNLLPGPEAPQLATYLGWLMHGVKGGLAAGIIFVVPGAIVMLALSLIYVLAGHVPVIDALFFGLKCGVLVFVIEAVSRIGRRALKGKVAWALAVAAFVALFFFHMPSPVVVFVSAASGFYAPGVFQSRRPWSGETRRARVDRRHSGSGSDAPSPTGLQRQASRPDHPGVMAAAGRLVDAEGWGTFADVRCR